MNPAIRPRLAAPVDTLPALAQAFLLLFLLNRSRLLRRRGLGTGSGAAAVRVDWRCFSLLGFRVAGRTVFRTTSSVV